MRNTRWAVGGFRCLPSFHQNFLHRVLVLYDGRVCGEFSHDEVTQEKIMAQIMENVLDKEDNKLL